MTKIKSQRVRSLIVHLNERHFILPPRNVGASTALLAKQQGYIEIEGDIRAAFKCRLTREGVEARAEIDRPLKC
jgi:hypothetical protein